MCKAVEISENILKVIADYHDARKGFSQQCSDADKEVVDLLHEIEFGKPDAIRITKIFKLMKAALLRRREAKDELYNFGIIYDTMKVLDTNFKIKLTQAKGYAMQSVYAMEDRKYRNRSDIIEQLDKMDNVVNL